MPDDILQQVGLAKNADSLMFAYDRKANKDYKELTAKLKGTALHVMAKMHQQYSTALTASERHEAVVLPVLPSCTLYCRLKQQGCFRS